MTALIESVFFFFLPFVLFCFFSFCFFNANVFVWVIIKTQKTLSIHGPARIVMSEKLFRWVVIYAKEVRSKVSGDERDLVFLS